MNPVNRPAVVRKASRTTILAISPRQHSNSSAIGCAAIGQGMGQLPHLSPPPDIASQDVLSPLRRFEKRRTGSEVRANESFALPSGAVTEYVWTSCIVRKTLAGCAPGYEIYKLGRRSDASEPHQKRTKCKITLGKRR